MHDPKSAPIKARELRDVSIQRDPIRVHKTCARRSPCARSVSVGFASPHAAAERERERECASCGAGAAARLLELLLPDRRGLARGRLRLCALQRAQQHAEHLAVALLSALVLVNLHAARARVAGVLTAGPRASACDGAYGR
eukprot:5174986-Pleurochrysis_carterae.AAC.2